MLLPPLYLDEGIDRRLALALRARGIDVTTVAEAATVSQDDRAQLVYATSQGRVLVSQNQIDFRRLHAQFRRDGRPHGGIMLIPQTVPFRRMEARVGLMLDLIATVPDHSSQLFTWTELQQRIIHGYRLPHWDEAVVREAVGWR